MNLKRQLALLGLLLAAHNGLYAQTAAGIKVLPKQTALYEHVTTVKNPYWLPFFGKKLGEKGFLLPYPMGIMLNAYTGNQDVTLSNLTVAFNDGPSISLDGIVGFSEVSAGIRNINVRPDVWILPFMDVYGIFGKAWVNTDVGIGSIMNSPVDLHADARFDGYVYGFGTLFTGGVRSVFFSLDFNMVWSHFDAINNNNIATNLSTRTGYIFHFKKNPERNISVWGGAGRVFISNTTEGTVKVSDVMPDLGQNYQSTPWYQQLSPVHQQLVDDLVQSKTTGLADDEIHYALDKRPAHDWCMIVGVQYQANRHWQFRTEVNFLGGRQSALLSANYRFGISRSTQTQEKDNNH